MTVKISTAFLILCVLFVSTGALLYSVRGGLIVAGVLLGAAGVLLLERPDRTQSKKQGSR